MICIFEDLCMEYHPPAAAAHKSLYFQLYSLSALYIWIVGFSRFVGSWCMQATEWAGSVAGVAGIQGRSKRLTYAGVVMSTIYKPPLLIPRFLSFSFFFSFWIYHSSSPSLVTTPDPTNSPLPPPPLPPTDDDVRPRQGHGGDVSDTSKAPTWYDTVTLAIPQQITSIITVLPK